MSKLSARIVAAEIDEITTPAADQVVAVVEDPEGTPVDKYLDIGGQLAGKAPLSAINNDSDFYEEGTWTPSESTKGNLTGTASFGTATYTKVGNLVTVHLSSISGLSITSDSTRTFVILNPTGLPGVTNDTRFFGGARTNSGNGEVAASALNVTASDDTVGFYWISNGTGSVSITNLFFQYVIQPL